MVVLRRLINCEISVAWAMRNLLISKHLSDFKNLVASWGDLRLFSLALGIWAGVLLSHSFGFIPLLIVLLISLLIAATRRPRTFSAVILVVILFSAVLMSLRSLPLHELERYVGKRVNVEVVVTGDPVVRSQKFGSVVGESFRMPARLEMYEVGGSRFHLRVPISIVTPHGDYIPSERLRFSARVIAARGASAGTLISIGAVARIGGPSHLQSSAMKIRRGMRAAVDHRSPDVAGLLPGLVLGDTSQIDARLTSDMKTTGLTHLTAVSGANLAILSALILFVMKWVRFFVVLVRPQPSVMRAGAMAVVMLVAYGRGVKRAALPALAAAIFFLLLIDPWQGLTFGFALSVAATAGLLLIAPGLAFRFSQRMPSWLAQALAIPIAAQLMCAPLILALSGNLSIVGVLANCVAAPLVAPATLLGLLAAMLSVLWLPLASFIAWCACIPTGCISWIAHHSAALPFASLPWGSSAIAIALFVLLLLFMVLLFKVHARTARLLLVTILVALVASAYLPTGWPPSNWVMLMCDVGQGDGLILNGGSGKYVVVDTGPDPIAIDRCLRTAGVHHIALLLLTHDHADHVEGLPGVLRGRRVDEIWSSPLDDPPYEVARVRKWSQIIRMKRAPVGRTVRIGELEISPLWPQRIIKESAPNNSSVALLVTIQGIRIFLAADMEAPAQEELLSFLLRHQEISARNIDVLKVAHHGSAKQSPLLAAYLHPLFALVSVGEGNPYHHPSPLTLHLFAHARLFRTDRDGSVAVVSPLAVVKPRRTIWHRAG
ncbi:MAG: ComEC/Rec2 family competence protein [Actinobacteria bacterium]|nr:ComEC/Rec2 family competence protein [Actinomycetota bacterium]